MEQTVADDPVLRKFREVLDQAYGNRVERVVLFGSRARGDHREDSDYDVAVFLREMEDWWKEVHRLVDISYDHLGEAAPYISAKPFLAGSITERTPLMHEIRKDGLDL